MWSSGIAIWAVSKCEHQNAFIRVLKRASWTSRFLTSDAFEILSGVLELFELESCSSTLVETVKLMLFSSAKESKGNIWRQLCFLKRATIARISTFWAGSILSALTNQGSFIVVRRFRWKPFSLLLASGNSAFLSYIHAVWPIIS